MVKNNEEWLNWNWYILIVIWIILTVTLTTFKGQTFILWGILAFGDIYFTHELIFSYKLGNETNPIARFFMKHLKTEWWMPFVGLHIFIISFLINAEIDAVHGMMIGVYAMIVKNNYVLYKKKEIELYGVTK